MNNSPEISRFAKQLLHQEESLNPSQYEEYRMNLENALRVAESREKLIGRIAAVTFATGLALMFVGGTKVFGDFDPGSKGATMLSVTLGVIYILSMIVFWISLACYFSRFRPKVRNIEGQLRDASLLALRAEVAELRKQIDGISRRFNAE